MNTNKIHTKKVPSHPPLSNSSSFSKASVGVSKQIYPTKEKER